MSLSSGALRQSTERDSNVDDMSRLHYRILPGDALRILRECNFQVDCVVTSPPYYRKRTYGESGLEIGQERSVEDYIEHLCDVMQAIPLASYGSIWVNMGDKRNSNGGLMQIPSRFALAMEERGWTNADAVVWAKSVVQQDGTTDGGCMPEPAKNRLNGNGYEMLYRFVSGKIRDAWTDTQAVALPRQEGDCIVTKPYLSSSLMQTVSSIEGRALHNVWRVAATASSKHHYATYPQTLCERPIAMTCPMWVNSNGKPRERIIAMQPYDEGRNRAARIFGKYTQILNNPVVFDGDAERVPVRTKEDLKSFESRIVSKQEREKSGRMDSGRHYIARKPVTIGWTELREDWRSGIVLDPFCGSGSTGCSALKLGRSFIGIDLYVDFCQLSEKACKATLDDMQHQNLNPFSEAR